MISYYYLHTVTRDLIHKNYEPESDSPFVKAIWICDNTDRANAWKIILESLALGANIDRVRELCGKWNCDLKDFEEMLPRVRPTELMKQGATVFLGEILDLDVDEYWDKLRQRGLEDK